MKTFLNDDVLIYIETKTNEKIKIIGRIITFFRHTHNIHKTEWKPIDETFDLYELFVQRVINNKNKIS